MSTKTMFKPSSFLKAIVDHDDNFVGTDEQDSHQLVSSLISCLSEDLNRVLVKPNIEQPEFKTEVGKETLTDYHRAANEFWSNHLKCEYSIIEALFMGQFKSTIQFPNGTKSTTFEKFLDMQIPLPHPVNLHCDPNIESNRLLDETPISLRSCFESFTREEAGVDCRQFKCSKTIELWKIPPILIIQLKRFERVNDVCLKLEQCIEFPLEGQRVRENLLKVVGGKVMIRVGG
jgi:ubiquitin carboxyl-terminal hydrolase 8